MATKKFKALPKDSQRAAFAQMDEDGSRQRRSGGGGVAFSAKNSERLLGLRSNTNAARRVFEAEIKPLRAARDEAIVVKKFYEDNRVRHLSGYKDAIKDVSSIQKKINKQYDVFSKIETARQSFKVAGKRAKQTKLF